VVRRAELPLVTAVLRVLVDDAALHVDRAAPFPTAQAVRPGAVRGPKAALAAVPLRATMGFAALAARPAADPEVPVAAPGADRGTYRLPDLVAAEPRGALTVLLTRPARRAACMGPGSGARPIAAEPGGAASVLLTSGARGTRRIDRILWFAGIVRGTSG
jgi:hypothetical protein